MTTFAEMTPYMTMKAFIDEGLSYASFLHGVGQEMMEADLVEKHGASMFSYLKALWLEGHDLLAPIKFPKSLQNRKYR